MTLIKLLAELDLFNGSCSVIAGPFFISMPEDLPDYKELPYYRPHNGSKEDKYQSYIEGPIWGKLRREVLARDLHWCQFCGMKPANHVHHLTYERFGKELLTDLVSLCETCHNSTHNR